MTKNPLQPLFKKNYETGPLWDGDFSATFREAMFMNPTSGGSTFTSMIFQQIVQK
jgi:hypothetical protein